MQARPPSTPSRAVRWCLIVLLGCSCAPGDAAVGPHADAHGSDVLHADSAYAGDISALATPFPDGLYVTFIDVGQGDAALFELPGGETILIDGGDNREGYSAILPLLRDKRIAVLDLMVLSHPHADHCGGLDEVLGGVDVLEIWKNGESYFTGTYEDFVHASLAEGAALLIPDQGHVRRLGGVILTVLNSDEGYAGQNNDSLVLMVSYGSVDILMTGDIEEEEQLDLVHDYGAALDCEVLKVPHHGSRYFARELFDTARPELAVISVGAGNSYGHPSAAALGACWDVGAVVCRTDTSGDVTVSTDGASVRFGCGAPR